MSKTTSDSPPQEQSPFMKALMRKLFTGQFNNFTDNHDSDRFGKQEIPQADEGIEETEQARLAEMGYVCKDNLNKLKWRMIGEWAPHFQGLEWFFSKLEGERSKHLLSHLVAYSIMGPRAIKLPRNNAEFWELRKKARTLADNQDTLPSGFRDWKLSKFDLNSAGLPITLYSRPPAIVAQMLLEQYVEREHGVEVEAGDVAIDAGGCWGDTALNFAHRCGPDGKVFSFEFTPSNLEIFHRNLELNPELSDRISIVEKAVWDKAGDTLEFKMLGPATSATRENQKGESISIPTETIDNLVSSGLAERVDFIKMDVEGAEVNALKGSVETLKKFKPKLAISLYHNASDFVDIPRFLDSLNLGYKFSIDHFTIHSEETVLFAWCPND